MGGGGIKNSESQLQTTAATQAQTASNLGAEGQTLINEGQAQQAPLVNFLQSIIGGNSTATNTALAPALGNITSQTVKNRENIYDSTAPGAGRDVLLGENQLNEGSAVAGLKNNTFLQAFPELASLAGGNTSAGLGLTGAGITSLSNSATTTGSVLNAQEQQKSQALSAFTGLAGVAGSIATGGISPSITNLFGGGSPASGPGYTTLQFPGVG